MTNDQPSGGMIVRLTDDRDVAFQWLQAAETLGVEFSFTKTFLPRREFWASLGRKDASRLAGGNKIVAIYTLTIYPKSADDLQE
jgi:hypothetical protein